MTQDPYIIFNPLFFERLDISRIWQHLHRLYRILTIYIYFIYLYYILQSSTVHFYGTFSFLLLFSLNLTSTSPGSCHVLCSRIWNIVSTIWVKFVYSLNQFIYRPPFCKVRLSFRFRFRVPILGLNSQTSCHFSFTKDLFSLTALSSLSSLYYVTCRVHSDSCVFRWNFCDWKWEVLWPSLISKLVSSLY